MHLQDMEDHKNVYRFGRDLGLRFFTDERFRQCHPRVYDAPGSAAWINEAADFVVNYPIPTMDYERYVPRAVRLNLADPKKKQHYLRDRIRNLNRCLEGTRTERLRVLELGCAEGSCLEGILNSHSQAVGVGVEPSAKHRELAQQKGLDVRGSTADLDEGMRFDLICSFHTFEHYLDPLVELETQKRLLADGGAFVCEIPSLTDPLLQLYGFEEFKDFYFQRQHPFVYSPSSIRRLLEYSGFTVDRLVCFQRYGLSNHLNWLLTRGPGDNEGFQEWFAAADGEYRRALEAKGQTDTMFVRFRPAD